MSKKLSLVALALLTLFSANVAAEPKGWLIVEGGSNPLNPVIAAQFRELIGGADAPVLFIPTALDEAALQKATAAGYIAKFAEQMGLKNCKILHTRDRKEADSEAFVAPIRVAKGIWIGGGRPGYLAEAYVGTRTQTELQAFYDRGGVIGGSSAGAMILGSLLLHGGTSNEEVRALVSSVNHEGLGFLKNVVIVPHMNSKSMPAGYRENEAAQAVAEHPELLGIGIDTGTALLVHGHSFVAVGGPDARVAIADSKQHDGKSYYYLRLGERFNLNERVLEKSLAQ